MTSPNGLDPKLLAAVLAAVQSYIEDEEAAAMHPPSRRLNAWKLAAWHPMRSRTHPLDLGWRLAG